MLVSTTVDMEEYQAHQRSIVRHFAPHLSNAALTLQERRYFALSLVRLALVFALPSCAVFYHHDSFLVTPVFAIVVVVCVIELVLAMYRYFVLWPEGLRMRWNYWHEIELSEDCYKLKILGYYHRKIAKFAGRFPPSMTSSQIRSYYRTRAAFLFVLFVGAYVSFLALLVRTPESKVARTWVLYALSVASALVVLRFAKLHLIELPQVLALRIHPEFAADLMPPSAAAAPEAIPFARPVPTSYQATDRIAAPIVDVDVEKAQSNYV
ncbi:hypothetical protein FI667_g4551, partial [Globisporangium splendens]